MLDAFEFSFVWAVVQAYETRFQSPASSPSKQIVRRAEEYVRSIKHRPVSVLEMCRVCEDSERALHNAFNQELYASPSFWLRTLRLNCAYTTLRQAMPKRRIIKKVDLEQGFTHFGRFAEQYRSLFGETPLETS